MKLHDMLIESYLNLYDPRNNSCRQAKTCNTQFKTYIFVILNNIIAIIHYTFICIE